MYKFLIADDHPLFREAIVDVIQLSFPDSHLQQAPDLQSALELGQDDEEIDLVLLDLNMPGMAGLDGLVDFRKNCPTLPVVIISADEDKAVVLKSISEGAVGYITKSSSRQDIAQALEQVLEGNVYLPADILRKATVVEQKPPSMIEQMNELDPQKLATLTRRQLIVLERISNGESNKMIAYNLNIAETTVKAHVSAILRKLEVHNRIQAALVAGKVDFNSYLKR